MKRITQIVLALVLLTITASAQERLLYGFTPEQEQTVRLMLDKMQPSAYPENGIVLVPAREYRTLKLRLAKLGFMANNGSPMNMGRGFTLKGSRRIYMDGGAWDNQWGFFDVLAHELGHYAAQGTSEEEADHMAKPYRERLKQFYKGQD